MPNFTLTIHNLRGLRHIEWSPHGVCALVGPNGAGKSTLLLALKLLRTAVDKGLPEAVSLVLSGSEGLKHRDAAEDEPILVQVNLDQLCWRVQLRPNGASVDYRTEESLERDGQLIYKRDALGAFELLGDKLTADARLGLRAALDTDRDVPEVVRMASFLRSIVVFHDLDLYHLRHNGSNTTQASHLHSRGHNAITMLRRWSQERPDRWRYNTVVDALKSAFPNVLQDIDFQEAGSTIVARIYRPGHELPVPLAHESSGLIAMLIGMCALVSTEEGGVVAIDEAGESLHPFALREFARQAERLARTRKLTVLLASHNTVLIDHFNENPHQVYALTGDTLPGPTALTLLKNPAWLQQFRLGELYADGALGSNDPAAA